MFARLALVALGVAATASAFGQTPYEGFLCCNMRTDGSWISDSNYAEGGKQIIPVGTPTKVTGTGRYRVHVEINGKRQALGNDYSRDLNLEVFAKRYVVTEDPKPKIASSPPKIRDAINSARVTKGMNREQVLMAVGYPMSSENPHLDSKVWRFWLSSFAEFQVLFGDDGRVKDVTTDPQTRNIVVLD